VLQEIKSFKPKLVLLFGGSAVQSFLGHRYFSEGEAFSISKWRGWVIPDQELRCWVAPLFHPSYVKRMSDTEAVEIIFKQDLERALSRLDVKLPDYSRAKDKIEILHDPKEIKKYLAFAMRQKWGTHDFETTGIKPVEEGHDIVSVGMCHAKDRAVSFPMLPEIRPLFCEYLDSKVWKVNQNIKYEEKWGRAVLKQRTRRWLFDTMIASHILRNDEGITGLKFQVYVRYGIIDYSSHLKQFMNSGDSHKINHIKEANLDEVLLYGGLDSLYNYWLAKDQVREMHHMSVAKKMGISAQRRREQGKHIHQAYNLFHQSVLMFCDIEDYGIHIDVNYFETQLKNAGVQIEQETENLFLEYEEGRLWKKTYKMHTNFNSDDQLRDILYNRSKGYITEKTTSSGNKMSVNVETLESFESPFTDAIVKIRQLDKARKTYIKNILEETRGGIVNCSINLHIPSTYRGSCSNPNLQNIPIRNKNIAKLIRRGFYPRKDHLFLEIDFKGMEVCVAACYHKDPNMIEEITNPDRDMHDDMGIECYMLDKSETTDRIRYCGKNKFVFPEFYGSYYVDCADALWNAIKHMNLTTKQGVDLYDHLRRKGIKTYSQFEKHIQQVEDKFWNERFKVYNKWRQNWWKEYNNKGYIELFTGFICSGVMRRNEAINYPVQGPAFHCLLWCLIQMHEWIRAEGLDSRICLQIHDCGLFDTHPDELITVANKFQNIISTDLPAEWDWLIVPLTSELEACRMNESWYHKEKLYKHTCPVCSSPYSFKSKDEEEHVIQWECAVCGDIEKETMN
jgi:DNA polymerase-1